ncbi:hypothetical protein ACFOWX_10960 [Sphingorhabdus arenilitoris]|uniref:Uncharacterized protein n=1 Tax=Sphingorhabdus arenilitoris TaxID=1490041 RepID=A0ABV8RHV0_9SPHN
MSDLYHKWLTTWGWGVVLFGLALAGIAWDATSGFTRIFFDLVGSPIAEAPDTQMRFVIGLMGCVTAGWGLTFMAVFKAAAQLSPETARPIWGVTTAAALFWYGTDSAISIALGYPLNAASNTVLLALYLIPIWRSGVLRGKSTFSQSCKQFNRS